MTDQEIEKQIREYFEENYELLRLEGGHALTEAGKQDAFYQVLYYWKKLKDIANKVTETEVKLSLPNQETTKGRKFSIEGVVDIVREENETWMYDIKTHDPDYVNTHKELYEKQLNIYAHIWHKLRGNPLDYTAIIATTLPAGLRNAIQTNNERQKEFELNKWKPVIEIPFVEKHIENTINDFKKVVDNIEDKKFAPPPLKVLQEKMEGSNTRFATRVCRNCDSRFSCTSYQEYVQSLGSKSFAAFKKYFNDFGEDTDQEQWIEANLENAPPPETVEPIT
ncbi:MAG: hypothetical protein HND40_11665 [Ignavibacteriota bacterium]|nr:hypothetical protein [Ignavibacteriota bacterium]MCO6446062.1 PD-(D/E)XK nuclease family protein [Ignavibacterium album]MCZ2267960.1 PD-(D/E)XK nuclease family protein [Ignavibacteriales bacterium]QKK00183.1 MAG: hypothetical protein HND40_11665 [Ignavibacteriota bacterium]HOJ06379.1 PD-(D/E)XK nuclease family protein [Ignavibacteriaceae bacterium]